MKWLGTFIASFLTSFLSQIPVIGSWFRPKTADQVKLADAEATIKAVEVKNEIEKRVSSEPDDALDAELRKSQRD